MPSPLNAISDCAWRLNRTRTETAAAFMDELRPLAARLFFARDERGRIVQAPREYVRVSKDVYARIRSFAGAVSNAKYAAIVRELLQLLPIPFTQEARLAGKKPVLNTYLHEFLNTAVATGDPALFKDVVRDFELTQTRQQGLCRRWLLGKHASSAREAFSGEIFALAEAEALAQYVEAAVMLNGHWTSDLSYHGLKRHQVLVPWLEYAENASVFLAQIKAKRPEVFKLLMPLLVSREVKGQHGIPTINRRISRFLDEVGDEDIVERRARRYTSELARFVGAGRCWIASVTDENMRQRLLPKLRKLIEFRGLACNTVRIDAVILPALLLYRDWASGALFLDRAKPAIEKDEEVLFGQIEQQFAAAFDARAAVLLIAAEPRFVVKIRKYGHSESALLQVAVDLRKGRCVMDAMM